MSQSLSSEIRTWGVICHLSALTYMIPSLFITLWYLNKPSAGAAISLPIVMFVFWFTPCFLEIRNGKLHSFINQQLIEVRRYQKSSVMVLLPSFLFVSLLINAKSIITGIYPNSGPDVLGSIFIGLLFGLVLLAIGGISAILLIGHLSLVIYAAFKASRGKSYYYPIR
jgi:uncharacterized Tic20 family protein